MSIEHDEKMPRLSTRIDKLMSWWVWNMMRKDASAINSSWWVNELMSIEHDEKRWFGNQLIRSLTCQPVRLSTRQPLSFCLFFSKKFNTKSALFIHQPLTSPQKIDSREGWFWCKKGVTCECSKMNFYLKQPPFAPDFGLFSAKYSAICR